MYVLTPHPTDREKNKKIRHSALQNERDAAHHHQRTHVDDSCKYPDDSYKYPDNGYKYPDGSYKISLRQLRISWRQVRISCWREFLATATVTVPFFFFYNPNCAASRSITRKRRTWRNNNVVSIPHYYFAGPPEMCSLYTHRRRSTIKIPPVRSVRLRWVWYRYPSAGLPMMHVLKPLVSHLRYASQVIPIRSQYLCPGNYRPFKVIQGNTVTLAHSDEPYMQKYGKIRGNPDSTN